MADFTILHLSDTHFLAGGALHFGLTDTVAALGAVLDRAGALDTLDLVACTGDLSDDGSVDSYETLKSMVEPWAETRGARVVYAMGNHDHRDGFRQVLTEAPDVEGPIYSAVTVDETRVIVLDTSIPRAGYGRVDDEQLAWLRAQLAEPAPGGTVIALHHAPVHADTALLRMLELQNADELFDAVRGSDVRLILGGHYHSALVDMGATVPVAVAPGVTNQADIFTEPGTESFVAGSGASIVRLTAAGSVRVLPFIVPLTNDGTRIFHYDVDAVMKISEGSRFRRPKPNAH